MSDLPRWRIVVWIAEHDPKFWSHSIEFEGFNIAFRFDGAISADASDTRGGSDTINWKTLYEVKEGHDGRYLRSPRELPDS